MVIVATLLSVQSRKTHGAIGDFSLPITLGVPINGPIIVEPRDSRGAHLLVFHFDNTVTSIGSASMTDETATPVGSAFTALAGNDVMVTHHGRLGQFNLHQVGGNVKAVNA